MPYLSRKDIEAIAAHVISDYKKLPRFAHQQVDHIDPEILCRELCGLSLEHFVLSKDRTILGLTAYSEMGVVVRSENGQPFIYYLDGNTILVEQFLKAAPNQSGRYHFTVMHETAHQLLARMFPKRREAVMHRALYLRDCGVSSGRDWAEWQADTLASALLMPIDIVWNALCKFDLQGGIEMLNSVYCKSEYERFTKMTELLGVSKRALAIRLKRLGVLKREYLDDPYELVNIRMEEDELL